MSVLDHKIDFSLLFTVSGANPNGDPLNGNRPRLDDEGYGLVTDVCLKRKIRNRLLDMGHPVFVQSDDHRNDGFDSLYARAQGHADFAKLLKDKDASPDVYRKTANKAWIDVRAFGQVFAFKGGLSVGIRGPLSIQFARSLSPITIATHQITKSVNSESGKTKGSDTMGTKYTVPFGLYRANGSFSVQLAEKTGLTDEDVAAIQEALRTLFVGDASSARPAGSMEVRQLIWWEQDTKIGKVSPAKVFRSLTITPKTDIPARYKDYDLQIADLDGVKRTVIDGM